MKKIIALLILIVVFAGVAFGYKQLKYYFKPLGDLTNMTYEQARETLKREFPDHHIVIYVTHDCSEEVEKGKICRQDLPEKTRVNTFDREKNIKLYVTVSSGRGVRIPRDFCSSGDDVDEMIGRLKSMGFEGEIRKKYEWSDSVEKDLLIRRVGRNGDINGQTIEYDGRLEVYISSGPKHEIPSLEDSDTEDIILKKTAAAYATTLMYSLATYDMKYNEEISVDRVTDDNIAMFCYLSMKGFNRFSSEKDDHYSSQVRKYRNESTNRDVYVASSDLIKTIVFEVFGIEDHIPEHFKSLLSTSGEDYVFDGYLPPEVGRRESDFVCDTGHISIADDCVTVIIYPDKTIFFKILENEGGRFLRFDRIQNGVHPLEVQMSFFEPTDKVKDLLPSLDYVAFQDKFLYLSKDGEDRTESIRETVGPDMSNANDFTRWTVYHVNLEYLIENGKKYYTRDYFDPESTGYASIPADEVLISTTFGDPLPVKVLYTHYELSDRKPKQMWLDYFYSKPPEDSATPAVVRESWEFTMNGVECAFVYYTNFHDWELDRAPKAVREGIPAGDDHYYYTGFVFFYGDKTISKGFVKGDVSDQPLSRDNKLPSSFISGHQFPGYEGYEPQISICYFKDERGDICPYYVYDMQWYGDCTINMVRYEKTTPYIIDIEGDGQIEFLFFNRHQSYYYDPNLIARLDLDKMDFEFIGYVGGSW
ncbi:MAG: hypothetical protein IJG64_00505 [Oscillospiraceae bacterium]|nr:hypothetical protein [Oscillospiraceae bacterium]